MKKLREIQRHSWKIPVLALLAVVLCSLSGCSGMQEGINQTIEGEETGQTQVQDRQEKTGEQQTETQAPQTETQAPQTDNQALQEDFITLLPVTGEAEKFKEKLADANLRQKLEKGNFEENLTSLESRGELIFPVKAESIEADFNCLVYDNGSVYTLGEDSAESVIFYLHGGAYLYQISASQVRFCDRLAKDTGAIIYLPQYPLAPRNNYRDAYALLDQVYADLLCSGKEIIFMGDSAGGGLALGYAEYLKSKNMQLPEKMVLISPWLDLSMSNPEIRNLEEKDLTLAVYGLVEAGKLWADDLDIKDARVSPIYGDLTGIPRTLLLVGTEEVMYPDVTALYQEMKSAGDMVSLIEGEGLWHDFPLYLSAEIPEVEESINLIEDFLAD